MNMNINWQVQNMTRVLNDGFVINVAWSCTASQNSASAFYGGTTTYENDPSEPGFIPYDQLTEEIVLGWVFAALGDQKAEIEANLTAKVEKQLNPTTANGMPW
jgi:hypothetical protein